MMTSKALFNEEDPESTRCKICYEETKPLVSCCQCTGSIGFSHQECLKEWLLHIFQRDGPDSILRCQVCQMPFDVTVNTARIVFSLTTMIALICSERYLAGVIGCALTIVISVYQIMVSLRGDLADITRQIFVPAIMIMSSVVWIWSQGFIRRSSTYQTDFVLRPKTVLN